MTLKGNYTVSLIKVMKQFDIFEGRVWRLYIMRPQPLACLDVIEHMYMRVQCIPSSLLIKKYVWNQLQHAD